MQPGRQPVRKYKNLIEPVNRVPTFPAALTLIHYFPVRFPCGELYFTANRAIQKFIHLKQDPNKSQIFKEKAFYGGEMIIHGEFGPTATYCNPDQVILKRE
jgi:hypothetical protein